MRITNKVMAILEKMRNVLLKETREGLPPLRGIERHRLFQATRKVHEVMNRIEFGNTTELTYLVYVGAVVFTEMLGVKNRKSTGMEPWWKKENEGTSKTKTLGILIP